MNLESSLKTYLDELSSNSPTPGGGNVAALCGVLSSSLGMMVCNLTIGKKKYLSVEEEVKNLVALFGEYKEVFVKLANQDNEAFDKVMEAFKLPKESDEEKQIRSEEIEKATFGAALIPAEVIERCNQLVGNLVRIREIGNQNSLSDVGVALSIINTACEGAYLNVIINCSSLNNKQKAIELLSDSNQKYISAKETVNNKISEIIKSLS
ncbi:MAG TPA: cyclodeaminase/cyclohydrolase family protein [Ignavibacteriaceae bacterium]|nr:cyclodeaminase/cyclohydrolase family protein [Ignavibacteriaceae bacterium]